MNCPSCNKNLAPTLSVCPSCGTMIYDSVREELALKISPLAKPIKVETAKAETAVKPEFVKTEPVKTVITMKTEMTAKAETKEKPTVTISPAVLESHSTSNSAPKVSTELPTEKSAAKSATAKTIQTAELVTKNTSPTLVEFHNKNTQIPEWRLQMQNAVRKRHQPVQVEEKATISMSTTPRRIQTATNGATALKTEAIEEVTPSYSANPKVENAMRRIEQSRRRHLEEENRTKANSAAINSSVKAFPTAVPNRTPQFAPRGNSTENVKNFAARPKFAETKVEKFDTNKLPPIPTHISSSFENRSTSATAQNDFDLEADNLPAAHTALNQQIIPLEDAELIANVEGNEDIDDCAPLSLRFNAAVFDLLIGSFLSILLLSPFMLLNGKFFSVEGFLAFLATCAIVMFVYMTTTIGFLSRTFGMKIFSLEIVDIDENSYPTIHQAAVSSSVYLVSLALGGIGFLTLLLNSEKRAAHDLLSGTIIVKEY